LGEGWAVGRFPGQFLRRTELIKRSLRLDDEPKWWCREPLQPLPLMRSGMPPHHPPRQRSSGPPSLTHGGSAATPRQTAPIPAPAIPARPSRLPHQLRTLSGSLNGCGTATGTVSPLQATLSTARAALAPRPASTWVGLVSTSQTCSRPGTGRASTGELGRVTFSRPAFKGRA